MEKTEKEAIDARLDDLEKTVRTLAHSLNTMVHSQVPLMAMLQLLVQKGVIPREDLDRVSREISEKLKGPGNASQ